RDDGIACTYCHSDVFRSSSAGMPAASVCMGCHSQIWTESPELEPVRAAYFSGAPLTWQRVTRLPHYVFFDHSVHVARGVGCETCHGRIDEMAEVAAVKPFTMEFCLDCHRSPSSALRPVSEVTNMGWQAPSAQPDYGERLRAARDVHPGTDCTSCHR
ncbi:MAG: cytochrome c3 family protein, partial [Polyangiaceae bacterium]